MCGRLSSSLLVAVASLTIALLGAACGGDDEPPARAARVDAGAGADVAPQPDADEVSDARPDDEEASDAAPDASLGGAALFEEHCATCHGASARGGIAPALVPWTDGRDALVARIATSMPPSEPDACAEDCAASIADFLLAGGAEPVDCSVPAGGRRQIRLLNPREYRNTVEDLLGETRLCAEDGECGDGETCSGGRCERAPCGATHFEYDAGDARLTSVHVAGSFNAWAGTIAAGGWAMRETSAGRWELETTLPPGRHGYKFVVDERDWITDPAAPELEDDAFGGFNSVVTVACETPDAPDLATIADTFPAAVRPESFLFDTHADASRVTSVHVVEQLRAGAELAARVVERLDDLVVCDRRDRSACEAAFLDGFAARAFRRPLTPSERERYDELLAAGETFEDGIELATRALLSSPSFLYRTELGELQADGRYRLTQWELASSLSYTLWGTMPDAELSRLAAAGELGSRDALLTQARRMVRDPRARAVLGVFAVQWLGVEAVSTAAKNPEAFPEVDEALRDAMLEETRRFVTYVAFDGSGGFDDLLRADFTFANARLAALYGADVPPAGFGRVALTDGRAGVLGQASVLATYAHSDQTSPIRRGLFVRRHLLCQSFPAPPPNAGGVPEVDPSATTRERFAQHTADPFCASCHQYIDDVGFGFEAFDPIGRARVEDDGHPIDSTGDMNDIEGLGTGTHAPYSSLRELAEMLADSEAAHACFVDRVYEFARGHEPDAVDACSLAPLSDTFAASGFAIVELLVQTAVSSDVIYRRAE
ncbi:MAG: DUF1592 domain-containing protein [Myxococcales bacterium]|nr:DUF1592 domain-containing protein [Myxococcales bacterium]MCB9530889.1 DUF1592 domain-containing protein [Myxococcales bacterium]